MPDPKRQRVRTSQEGADPETRPETNEEMLRRVAGEALREVEDAARARKEREIIPGNPMLDSVARGVVGARDFVQEHDARVADIEKEQFHRRLETTGNPDPDDPWYLSQKHRRRATLQAGRGGEAQHPEVAMAALMLRESGKLQPAIKLIQDRIDRINFHSNPVNKSGYSDELALLEAQLRVMLRELEQQAIEESRQRAAQSRMTE